ncbi:cytochrome P450 4c3-like [Atheta coriaria]|uniref:cytochrome P450 4c3-like n=1 Tax=Dalotia coriaria TaxID=877792 RepID=UPI0031F440C9
MIFLVLLGLGLFLAIVWWYIDYYRHFKGVFNIPRPGWMFPIFGHVFLAKNATDAYWVLHQLTMTVGKGKAIRGCLGYFYGINIADPAILERLLTHTSVINKSQLYKYAHRWLETGLLTSDHEKWRGRRKLLTPAYHFKILEQFIDVFDKNSNILVQKLQREVGKNKTDVFPFVTLCALDTICETAMGTCVNAQQCADSDYVQSIKRISEIVISRGISVLKQFDFYYLFTQDYRDETKCIEILHGYTMSVIQSRRKELLAKQNENEKPKQIEENLGYKAKIPFLDILLQATFNGEPLTDEDIREEVDTFMFEGHDTTSSAISFTIYCLANNPHVQKKVFEEQRDIFVDNPQRETTYQDLQEMKYLEMVIKETLRLYPSVPLYGRTVVEDFSIDKYSFKRGTEIAFGVFSLHRNPEIYPNPEVFDPERFTLEETVKRHPFSYLPFSAGYRNCVGQKFAMMEMKATIGMLVRKFVFQEAPDSELKLKSGLILSSATGVNVKITNRVW